MLYGRQAIDTDESFAAFVAYRDQRPPRRLDRIVTAASVRVPIGTSSTWYREHSWRERVAAWDAHLDSIRVEEIESVTRQGAASHAVLLADAKNVVAIELGKLLEQTECASEVRFMKPSELTKLLDTVVKLERLDRGQTTEKLEIEDLSGASLEKLRELRASLLKRND